MAAKPAAEGRSGVSNPKQTGFVRWQDDQPTGNWIETEAQTTWSKQSILLESLAQGPVEGVESQIRGYEEVALCPTSKRIASKATTRVQARVPLNSLASRNSFLALRLWDRWAFNSCEAGLSVNDFISKTKTQQRQGLKPSGPELIAYARYLGIDPVADHDLLWIAVEVGKVVGIVADPVAGIWTSDFGS